jgi:Type IV secretory pathway, VirD4 components
MFSYVTAPLLRCFCFVKAGKIVESANRDAKKDVWYYSQRSLLKALILYVIHESMPEDRNLRGVTRFLQAYGTIVDKKSGRCGLDEPFEKLELSHPARRNYELGFKQTQGETRASVIFSLLTTLADFVDDEVGEFSSFSDFDLQDIGKQKIILYIKIPILKKTYESLINLFLTQLFVALYDLGDSNHAQLPNCVNFILDEFPSLGKFAQYEEFLATCRGYGIGVTTICQSLTQLQDKYSRDKAESILGNNAVKMCLNAANQTTAKYFSSLLGKATVKVETGSTSYSRSTTESRSTSDSFNFTSRDLMTPDEIEKLPPDESIIVFTNSYPLRAKKAFQFKLFPGADSLGVVNQKDYEGTPDAKQLHKFQQKTEAFFSKTETQINELQTTADLMAELQPGDMLSAGDSLFNGGD